jgi:hypothetical protein
LVLIATIIGFLDVACWLCLCAMSLLAPAPDPTVQGFGFASAWWITALYLVFGLPGLGLAWFSRAPRSALGLVLAFPAAFIVVYVALTIAF